MNRCQPRGQPLHLALFFMVFSNAMQIKSFIVLNIYVDEESEENVSEEEGDIDEDVMDID